MVYRFFSGDFPITIALYLIIFLWARRRRSLVRDLVSGDTPIWNRIGQVTVGVVAIFPLWAAAADNWRQLLAYSLASQDRWKSDPFETAATPDALRFVTLALLVVMVVGFALLYARHRGPVGLMLLSAALAIAYFYILNPIRMRIDVLMVGTEASLERMRPLDVGFILFWASGLYILVATLIVSAVIAIASAVALPARLVYWLATRGRNEQEAEVFTVYRVRARALGGSGSQHAAPVVPKPPPSDSDHSGR